jgi:hypothetical protein
MIKINIDKLVLNKELFDHAGWIHGLNHVYRVMTNVVYLGNMLQNKHETQLALCAAYIHDMSRKHDGICHEHGLWAAQNKLPKFKALFYEFGLDENDIAEVQTAVSNHSLKTELDKSHPHYITTCILKDADALDRIRLGKDFLDTSYFRFNETKKLLQFSELLLKKTRLKKVKTFKEMLTIASNIHPIVTDL